MLLRETHVRSLCSLCILAIGEMSDSNETLFCRDFAEQKKRRTKREEIFDSPIVNI